MHKKANLWQCAVLVQLGALSDVIDFPQSFLSLFTVI